MLWSVVVAFHGFMNDGMNLDFLVHDLIFVFESAVEKSEVSGICALVVCGDSFEDDFIENFGNSL